MYIRLLLSNGSELFSDKSTDEEVLEGFDGNEWAATHAIQELLDVFKNFNRVTHFSIEHEGETVYVNRVVEIEVPK